MATSEDYNNAAPLMRSTTSLDVHYPTDGSRRSPASYHSAPLHGSKSHNDLKQGTSNPHDSDDSMNSPPESRLRTYVHKNDSSPTAMSEPGSPPSSELRYAHNDDSDAEPEVLVENDQGVRIAGPVQPPSSTDDIDASNAQSKYPPEACAFIANLPKNILDEVIIEHLGKIFGPDGPIFRNLHDQGECWVILRRNHANANPFAFVQYKTTEEAKLAIEQGILYSVCGRQLRTEAPRAMRSLYISRNDGVEPTEVEITEFLQDYRLTNIDKPTNSERQLCGLPHGYWAEFQLYGEAKEAITALRSHEIYHIHSRSTRSFGDTPDRSRPFHGRVRSGGSVQPAGPYYSPGPRFNPRYSHGSPGHRTNGRGFRYRDDQEDFWQDDRRSVSYGHGPGSNGSFYVDAKRSISASDGQRVGGTRHIFQSNAGPPGAVQRYFHPNPVTHRMRASITAPADASVEQLQTIYNPNGPSIGSGEHVFDCNCTYCHAKAWHHLRRNSIGLPAELHRLLSSVDPNNCVPNGVHLLEVSYSGVNQDSQTAQANTFNHYGSLQNPWPQYANGTTYFHASVAVQSDSTANGTAQNGGKINGTNGTH